MTRWSQGNPVPLSAELARRLTEPDSPKKLAAYVLRTKDEVALNAMARAATAGSLDCDDLVSGVLGGALSRFRQGLRYPWIRHLAVVIGLLDPTKSRAALALFKFAAADGGLGAFETETADVFAQIALHEGDLETLDTVLAAHPLSPSVRWAVRCDTLNPFLSSRGDMAGWLATVNETLLTGGLEAIALKDDDNLAPFERLSSSAPTNCTERELVTVVMPAFKPGREIFTAVRSILAQTWGNLELLIVDDASPAAYEATFQRVAAMDPRVRVIRQPENGGTYAARNRGLAEARGTFVTFQDADDWSHPRRIERQIAPLDVDDQLLATRSRSVRAYPDLRLTYPGYRPDRINASSLLFRREPVLTLLGGFDPVRKSADIEFPERLRAVVHNSLVDLDGPPMAFVQLRNGSLSRADATPGWIRWSRIAYRNSYRQWHREIRAAKASGFLKPHEARPFPVPEPSWQPDRTCGTDPEFDVIVLNDWRTSRPGIHRQINEVALLRESGYRVAAAHLETPIPLAASSTPLAPELQRLINHSAVPLVHVTQPVTARDLIIAHPDIASFLPSTISLRAEATHVDLTTPESESSTTPLPLHTAAERVRNALGHDPQWIARDVPATKRLEDEVTEAVAIRSRSAITVASLTLATDRRNRGVRPVIGTQPLEYALDATDNASFMSAFPDNDAVDVRLRGNINRLHARLGTRVAPPNWVTYEQSEISIRTFLAQLDVFICPFPVAHATPMRQSIIEAMAAGCIVVLHPEMREVYRDAGVYATPSNSTRLIINLYADQAAATRQRARSIRFARQRFSLFQTEFSHILKGAHSGKTFGI